MKNKIISYICLGVVGLLLLPPFLSAGINRTEPLKKVVGGKTYTSVFKSFEKEDADDNDFYIIQGALSPNKFTIYKELEEENDYEILVFDNGVYRDTNATPAEIFEAQRNMKIFGLEEYYDNDYIDDNGNEKVGIFYNNYYAYRDFYDDFCYVDNKDALAVDGKSYYKILEGQPQLITDFNPEKAYEYYVIDDCGKYYNVFMKDLTDDEVELITTLMENSETAAINNQKHDINVYVLIKKIAGNYYILIGTVYREDEGSEQSYSYILYDFFGKKIDEFEGYGEFYYLDQSELFVAATDTDFRIYDAEFNIIYKERRSNLPNDELFNYHMDNYTYSIDYDSNTAYFVFGDHLYMTLTRYVVEEGDNQRFSGKDLTIKFNGDLDLLDEVYVNDNVLDSKNYTKAKGSTIITLSKDYLSSLKDGTYTLKATYTDGGEATSTFIINKALENPATGDNVVSTIILGSISLIGLFGIGLYLKKKNYKNY